MPGAAADGCLGCGPRQIENEFGFLGPNQPYLRHLLASARASLGDDVMIYTTDPPPNLAKGTLPGAEVYSCAPAPLPLRAGRHPGARSLTAAAVRACAAPCSARQQAVGCDFVAAFGAALALPSAEAWPGRRGRVVDFGAGWFDLNQAFGMQRAMNAPGKSPAMCSEF